LAQGHLTSQAFQGLRDNAVNVLIGNVNWPIARRQKKAAPEGAASHREETPRKGSGVSDAAHDLYRLHRSTHQPEKSQRPWDFLSHLSDSLKK
jgi:hypothetical protein